LQQQIEVFFEVMIPQHVIQVFIPLDFLVNWQDKFIVVNCARNVLTIAPRFVQLCYSGLRDLDMAIYPYFNLAASDGQDLSPYKDPRSGPVAIGVVVLFHYIHAFIQSSLDLELLIVFDVSNKVDKYPDAAGLIVGVTELRLHQTG
jgi:hypothetical protein